MAAEKRKVLNGEIVPASTPIRATLSLKEVGEFGKGAASKAASLSSKLTSTVRGSDTDEIGKLLGNLVVVAKDYDPKRLKRSKNPMDWFKKKALQVQTQYSSVDTQIGQLSAQINERMNLYKNRITDLESLSKLNEETFYELGETIEQLDGMIAEMEENPPELDETDTFSSQRLHDHQTAIQFAKKRSMNLRLLQENCRQLAPQIKLTEVNSVSLSQKFDDIQYATIPALKQTFGLYILQIEQKNGVDLANAVDDATNEAMRRSADLLESNTVNVHKALGRNVIDTSTLEYTAGKLIAAVQAVQKVTQENQLRLEQDRPKLEAMSQNLGRALTALNAPQVTDVRGAPANVLLSDDSSTGRTKRLAAG